MTGTSTPEPATLTVEQVSPETAEEGQRPTRVSTSVDDATWNFLREYFRQRALTSPTNAYLITYGELANAWSSYDALHDFRATTSLWKKAFGIAYPQSQRTSDSGKAAAEETPMALTGSAALIGTGTITASGVVSATPADTAHMVSVYLSHTDEDGPIAGLLRTSLPAESLFEDIADHITIGDLDVSITDPHARSLVEQFMSRLVARDRPLTDAELRRALAALDDVLPPTSGTPESDLGPFYTANALAARWGTTRQAVNKRYHRNTLLGLPTTGRAVVYPAFQFANPDRPQQDDVLPAVREVTDLITGAGEPKMVVASWLTAPDPRLGDRSAIDWLRDGGDPAVVIGLARTDVKRWAT